MIKLKRLILQSSNHVNKENFTPTWAKKKTLSYIDVKQFVYIDTNNGDDESEPTFPLSIGWLYDHGKHPLLCLANHIINLFDAYDVGYRLDYPHMYKSFGLGSIITDRDQIAYVDNVFQHWCMIYAKDDFKKLRSYQEHRDWYENNIYSFRKTARLVEVLCEMLEVKDWQDIYNWCIKIYNEESLDYECVLV